MKTNVGGSDKFLRIVIGMALILWAILGGPALAWLGVLPLATGVFNFCGIYELLGISTRKES